MVQESLKNWIMKITLLISAVIIFLGSLASQVNAANYTVDNVTDDAALSACSVGPADCSLRGAISNANGTAANDTIDFDDSLLGQTIILDGNELMIANNGSLNLIGLGSDRLSISGGGRSRVFSIKMGASVAIADITVTGGQIVAGGGGGIFAEGGQLTIRNSTISENSAGWGGGGILAGGTLIINDSTIRNNNGGDGAGGIGGRDIQINRSTISGNTARIGGGMTVLGTSTMNNSTVSGNSATGNGAEVSKSGGGGILINGGTLTLNSSTITNNKSSAGGAGIENPSGEVKIGSTIVAGNSGLNEAKVHDLSGAFLSYGFNLVGFGGTGFDEKDQIGINPRLGELKNNGGPTETHALLADSPAIDGGKNFDGKLRSDQRGPGFSRILDYRKIQANGDLTDIGSFELEKDDDYLGGTGGGWRGLISSNHLVDNISDDALLSTCTEAPNDCSLRGAIKRAEGAPGADKITFDPSLEGQTIVLSGDNLTFGKLNRVEIEGPGAEKLTISGNNLSRVFYIDQDANVRISGLKLTNGNAGDGTGFKHLKSGGAIYNAGTLTLNFVTISGNTATGKFLEGHGGGISNTGNLSLWSTTISENSSKGAGAIDNHGLLSLYFSTLSNNTGGSGGAIDNIGGTVFLNYSTIENNTAAGDGGGISNSDVNPETSPGLVTVKNSTISGNIANGSNLAVGLGGGIHNSGTVILANSTVSNNTASAGGGISNIIGKAILKNSTITGNFANHKREGLIARLGDLVVAPERGGGIFNREDGAVTLGNTIVADNRTENKADVDLAGRYNSIGFNLIGDVDKATGFGVNDLVGGRQNPVINAALGPLAENGGMTKSHALLCGSPAIDAGKNLLPLSKTDQRNVIRIFDDPKIRNASDGTDIGALEVQLLLNCN